MIVNETRATHMHPRQVYKRQRFPDKGRPEVDLRDFLTLEPILVKNSKCLLNFLLKWPFFPEQKNVSQCFTQNLIKETQKK